MANGKGHRHHRQPECGGNTQEPNPHVRKGGRQYGASAAAENQPKRADEFGG
jgi:hypothetical protein